MCTQCLKSRLPLRSNYYEYFKNVVGVVNFRFCYFHRHEPCSASVIYRFSSVYTGVCFSSFSSTYIIERISCYRSYYHFSVDKSKKVLTHGSNCYYMFQRSLNREEITRVTDNFPEAINQERMKHPFIFLSR